MTEQPSRLGHGVEVERDRQDGLVVSSTAGLVLPWRPRSGGFVGSAVHWAERLFEVCTVTEGDDGVVRWHLESWPDGEVVRHVDRLDSERIEALAGEWRETGAGRRIRTVLVWLAPVTGLMPTNRQLVWERRYNVSAGRITAISAAVEILVGAVGIVMPIPLLLRLLGWMFFAEGVIRFWFAMSQDEGMGSFVTLPLAVQKTEPVRSASPASTMEVVRWDPTEGGLELAFAESRTDWTLDGVLRYRGERFRLIERIPGGGRVVYAFGRASDDMPVTLSLVPPPTVVRQRERGRGFLKEVGRLFLLSLAPGRFQAALTPEYRLAPRTLTWGSGIIELIGSGMNLVAPAGEESHLLLSLFFVGEGLFRIVVATVTGAPVGSVLGLPFRPLFERWSRERLTPD